MHIIILLLESLSNPEILVIVVMTRLKKKQYERLLLTLKIPVQMTHVDEMCKLGRTCRHFELICL